MVIVKSWVLFFVLAVFLPSLSSAELIAGFVQWSQDSLLLRTRPGDNLYPMISSNWNVNQEIRRLQDGDFISAQGFFDFKKNIIFIDSVDVVGLKALVGTWRSWNSDEQAPQQIFEFASFNQLNIFTCDPAYRSLKECRTQKLTYSVAPARGNDWTIFFADGASVVLGTLQLGAKQRSHRVAKIITYKSAHHHVATTITLFALEDHGR